MLAKLWRRIRARWVWRKARFINPAWVDVEGTIPAKIGDKVARLDAEWSGIPGAVPTPPLIQPDPAKRPTLVKGGVQMDAGEGA